MVKDIFFAYFMLFIREIFYKFVDELVFNGQDFCLDLVFEFPLIWWEQTCLIFKAHLWEKIVILIEVVSFSNKIEFSVSHCETWELGWWGLEANLLPIVEDHIVPAYIETITCIHMDVHCGFKSGMYFVASAEEEDGGNWGVVADLLCVEGAAIYEGLVSLAQNRVEWLENIEEEEGIW